MATESRLLFVEPNPCGREQIPTEDLSILVELKTTSRGRSVIIAGSGTVDNNTESRENIPVSFIDGSAIGLGRKSLTTNYTQLREVGVNADDDLESLGIDNISIEFDTAYTPMIKIKFIDVRGKAILEPGTKSKYKMFFELPYPIFELTVKGFYGKAVTYCLHLTKWNASFNSTSGNFEIDADFIGYTYAMLTDCLMGLMRGTAQTTKGEKILERYKKEKLLDKDGIQIGDKLKYPGLKSIPEFLTYVQTISEKFTKLKSSSENIKQLNALNKLTDGLKFINKQLNNLITGSKEGTLLSKTLSRYIFITKKAAKDPTTDQLKPNFEKRLKDYKEVIHNYLNGTKGLNASIEIPSLTIDPKTQSDGKFSFASTDEGVIDIKSTYYDFTGDSDLGIPRTPTEQQIKIIQRRAQISIEDAKLIVKNLNTTAAEGYLYNLAPAYNEIDQVEPGIKNRRKKLTEALKQELKDVTSDDDYKITIGNVVTMLAIHAQVFLETIEEVSSDALSDSYSTERFNILKNRLINTSDNSSGVPVTTGDSEGVPDIIFPWPEYKEKRAGTDSEGNAGDYETWIGSKLEQLEYEKVPEIKFVEELLESLMNVAKSDNERLSNVEGVKGPQFYPVTPLDARIDYPADDATANDTNAVTSLINNNPYFHALKSPESKGTPDEATRLLLMRGFVGLGLGSVAPDDPLIKAMGKLEAENLYNLIVTEYKREDIRNMFNALNNEKRDELLNKWKEGSDSVINPTGDKKPLLEEVSGSTGQAMYRYTYASIEDSNSSYNNKAYIPISGGFDCRWVYDNGKFKSNSDLKKASENVIFIGNQTGTVDILAMDGEKYSDDGALYFKIMDKDKTFNKAKTLPPFGDKSMREFKKDIGADNGIVPDNYINVGTLTKPTYGVLNGEGDRTSISKDKGLDYYLGRYNTLQIENIVYGAPIADDKFNTVPNAKPPKLSSVICAYWSQRPGGSMGTHLSEKWTTEQKNSLKHMTSPKRGAVNDDNEFTLEENYRLAVTGASNRRVFPTLKGKVMENLFKDPDLLLVPHIEFGISHDNCVDAGGSGYDITSLSLFGSKFYYQQSTPEARAFLFLNTFAWNGVVGDVIGSNGDRQSYEVSLFDKYDKDGDSFEDDDNTPILKGLFTNNAAFIKAPKLWCAFIGSLLYRYTKFLNVLDPIFIDNTTFPGQKSTSSISKIKPDEYFNPIATIAYPYGLHINIDNNTKFTKIDRSLMGLPVQIKNEFIRIFKEFVGGDFKTIQTNFELFEGVDDLTKKWEEINQKVERLKLQENEGNIVIKQNIIGTDTGFYTTKSRVLKRADILKVLGTTDKFKKVIGNCFNISPMENKRMNDMPLWTTAGTDIFHNTYQFNFSYEDSTEAQIHLIGLIQEEVMVMNAQPRAFVTSQDKKGNASPLPDFTKNPFKPIEVRGDILETYIDYFKSNFNKLTKDWSENNDKDNDTIQQKLFNAIDDDIIKLNIYRTLSSINNKWIGGSHRCSDIRGIAESFKFLDSGFGDISDQFFINPELVSKKIIGNYNQSFFDVVNKLLSDNNFNFIPLPAFTDFKTKEGLESVFKPYPYKEYVPSSFNYSNEEIKNDSSVKPAFICVYAGQTSTNLDLGDNETHKDDGIYIHSTCKDSITTPTVGEPDSFSGVDNPKSMYVPYFLVSYGKENQSFFKDVRLDQREFTETAESLQIIEDLSRNSGDKRQATFKGQNLFNIYQTRSYSAEIEMMGNAMIQPMMYFQLNNIPMFRGAYLIIKTSHNITAHNMTTKIKGVRVKSTKTPLLKEGEFFMNLLGDFSNVGEASKITNTSANSSTTGGGTNGTGTNATSGSANNTSNSTSNSNSSGNNSSNVRVPSGNNSTPTTNPNSNSNNNATVPANFIDTPLNVKIIPVSIDTEPSTAADSTVKPVGIVQQYTSNSITPYGIREVIETVQIIMESFYKEHSRKLYYNDLSRLGGGDHQFHHSHETGLDMDIRPIAKDTGHQGIENQYSAQYNRDLTRKLIKEFAKAKYLDKNGAETSQLVLDVIFFNDSVLLQEVKDGVLKANVKYADGHTNHLHVRFNLPERVKKDKLNTPIENSRTFIS